MDNKKDLYQELGVIEYNLAIYTQSIKRLKESKQEILLKIDEIEAQKVKDYESNDMDRNK
jgi:predicted DNA-binding protein (UPF0251 family)